MMTAHRLVVGTAIVALLLSGRVALPASSFVTFESGQVRPLALAPDGSRLFAVNTPDDRLEIFAIGAAGDLTHTGAVAVGLEPVAVAARTSTEVWVVNHLSDSVSIVDVGTSPPRVVRTLLVGDEPRDIVFAGPGANRAFITCAHRGQNDPNDPQLTTPGVGRADVWAFDATNPDGGPTPTLGGRPLSIVTLFGDTPRALAVSPDGGTVYAAVFHSGNQTTAISEGVVCDGGAAAGTCTLSGVAYPGGLPAPNTDANGAAGPETGLVVRFNPASGHWEDRLGRNWDNAVRFRLPDDDVFRIDANANPPAAKPSAPHPGQPFAHVATILFDMTVNPASGRVYVTNGEARNEVRFEGQRPPCGSPTSVVGHLSEARITVLDPGTGSVTPRRLNKHIDYCTAPSPGGTAAASLATPLGMAITGNGATLYVAAFGSGDPGNTTTPGTKGVVGVLSTAQLENDTFVPSAASHVLVTGGGASGLVLDEPRHRLYVFTRFDNGISVVDTTTGPGVEIAHLSVFNPEPAAVVAGRPFLYDATFTSSNGEAACASCHVFGDLDSLAWDLGNPSDVVKPDQNPFRTPPGSGGLNTFHPLKGPMTTQTLRGLANDGPMHWRGDRTGAPAQPLDETLAFEAFNVAFPGLLGRTSQLTAAQMQAFTDFILQVMLPPNPIRALDGSLTPDQAAGRSFYLNTTSDIVQTCNGCHVLDPASGHFGTDGLSSFENETQDFKIPHLRNAYQKVGMFGMPAIAFINAGNNGTPGPSTVQPDQIRGFGFLHDGSVDTLFRFHNATVFNTGFGGTTAAANTLRRQVEQFVLAFDSDLAPVVGQQVTLTSTNASAVNARLNLLIARAAAGECDLVVKGNRGGVQRGAVRTSTGTFRTDRAADPLLTDAQVRALASTSGQELTYTCVPPGSGTRIGIDRDLDGCLDFDDADPTNPAVCAPVATTTSSSTTTTSTTTSATTSTRVTTTTSSTGTSSVTTSSTSTSSTVPAATTTSTPAGPTTTSTTSAPECTPAPVNDPKAVVVMRTRNGAGRLAARMAVSLGTYAGGAVTVTLADGDSPTIAVADVGPLAPLGVGRRRWQFRTTADGVQKIVLKSAGPRAAGTYKLQVKARHWFTAAGANEPAGSTVLTVRVGDACFSHAATKKVD